MTSLPLSFLFLILGSSSALQILSRISCKWRRVSGKTLFLLLLRCQQQETWSPQRKLFLVSTLSPVEEYSIFACAISKLYRCNIIGCNLPRTNQISPILKVSHYSILHCLHALYHITTVMCTHGGMSLSSDILGYPKASAALVRAVVGFMRNLCADDMRKENLGEPYLTLLHSLYLFKSFLSWIMDCGL